MVDYADRPCEICGTPFKPKKKNHFYCSLRCNNKAKLLRYFYKLRNNPSKMEIYIQRRNESFKRYYSNSDNVIRHKEYMAEWFKRYYSNPDNVIRHKEYMAEWHRQRRKKLNEKS